jgi:hypothetical protein
MGAVAMGGVSEIVGDGIKGNLAGWRLILKGVARYLRTNPRTLENWEQFRAKPNALASLLIRMAAQFPDMVHCSAAI